MCLTVDIVKQGPVNSLFRLVLLYWTYINTARLASQYKRALTWNLDAQFVYSSLDTCMLVPGSKV